MKLRTILPAAVAVAACGGVAVAGEIDQAAVVKVADQAIVERALPRRAPRMIVRPEPAPYESAPPIAPVACRAVLFPRSPLCAGQPASYGTYATFPWNLNWER